MAHYFDNDPSVRSDRRNIGYRQYGRDFRFVTDSDVFSRSEVDKGTDVLLSSAIKDIKDRGARKGEKLLDLGCGYGVVGTVMASVFVNFEITQVDVNRRAVALSKENASLNGVKIEKCVESDVLSALGEGEMFDVVITNPPVRAGKKTVFAFYDQAFEHMNPGSSIYVVLQRKQGAPSSFKKLEELFGNCETLEISGGYHVMKSVKEGA
ncbi:MAG: class I SAM-dependent methyltransferase [Clostridiales bacterium]|nr:class I SAM-dependent methyltransferase [Clostridiales bacterium]